MLRYLIEIILDREYKMVEYYVNFVCENLCLRAISVNELVEVIKVDELLKNVTKCINDKKWYKYISEEML